MYGAGILWIFFFSSIMLPILHQREGKKRSVFGKGRGNAAISHVTSSCIISFNVTYSFVLNSRH